MLGLLNDSFGPRERHGWVDYLRLGRDLGIRVNDLSRDVGINFWFRSKARRRVENVSFVGHLGVRVGDLLANQRWRLFAGL